jgi:integrating conjugative element membrane protein (TIGR03747 family)
MAVEKRQRPKSKPSFIKRVVMNWLCIALLGWVILMAWACVGWVQEGFEATYQEVTRLTAQQSFVFEEFSDASIAPMIARFMDAPLSNQSLKALEKAKEMQSEVTALAANRMADFMPDEPAALTPALKETVQDFQVKAYFLWMLMGVTAKLLLVKLAVILAAIPLFLLAITAGLVDGLNQRAIRTASLGRESTYVFHKSIPFARKLFFLVLGLWLAMPHALPPSPVFIGLSVLLSLVVSVTSSRFKKYL